MDELAADAIKKINISLKALNSPSSRSSSFLNPALLDSPNKTAKIS